MIASGKFIRSVDREGDAHGDKQEEESYKRQTCLISRIIQYYESGERGIGIVTVAKYDTVDGILGDQPLV